MRRVLFSVALALVIVLGAALPALADYTTADGYEVHWAGGDNITVFKDNKLIYSGPGQKIGDRLAWDGTRNVDDRGHETAATKVADAVTKDWLDSHPAETFGLGGSRPAGERGASSSGGGSSAPSRQSTASTNPYAHLGMTYTGMQPVQVNVGGEVLKGYANVYEVWDPVQQRSIGYSAIPLDSPIGRALKDANFQLDDTGTWVLIHYGASGAQVGWTPETETVGPSFANVSSAWPENPYPAGGYISITLPSSGGRSSGGGSSGGGGSYAPQPNPYVPPPDTRKLVAYPELPVVKVGGMVPLVAEVTGTCRQVTAFAGWGGSALLEPSADGRFRGVLQVPVNARPGVYPLVFEAVVGQVGYADRLFTVSGVLTVQAQGGGDAGPVPPAPGEEPDWWTPPEYQSP